MRSGLGIKHTVMLVCCLFHAGRVHKSHWPFLLIFDVYMFYFSAILEKQDSILRKMFCQDLQCWGFFFLTDICTVFFPSVTFNVYETSIRSTEEKRVSAYWQQLFLNLILWIAKVICVILWVSQSFTKMSISVERCRKKSWIPFETGLMLT